MNACFPERSRMKLLMIGIVMATVTLLHLLTPSGTHEWHWLHILYQKLFYVPLLMAAALLGVRWTMATTACVSLVFLFHVLKDWAGEPMLQAELTGEIISFWVIAIASSLLFDRERRALEEVRRAHEETIAALASSLDLREHETGLHSRRVREYTLLLAHRLGLRGEALLMNLGMGALLHDLGKIGVADRILLKHGELNWEDWQSIRRHPVLGASLIGGIGFLENAREIVLSHHEKFDGSGYPAGLSGQDIPLGARIFAVADIFDALTAVRPYRVPMSYQDARNLIAKESGKHLDPAVVDAFLGIPFAVWAEIASRNGVTLTEA